MRIEVRVKPRSSQEKIVRSCEGVWVAYLHAAPEGGKANEALIRLVAEELRVAKSNIQIVRGESSRKKIIEVAQ